MSVRAWVRPRSAPRTASWLAAVAIATGGVACDPGEETGGLAGELAGPAPDYVVAELGALPGAVALGQSFPLPTTVENVGDAAAAAVSTTRYFLSVDPVVGVGDAKFAQTVQVPPLGIGASDTATATLVGPSGVPDGSYFVMACADRNNTVPESDNRNNCAAAGPIAVTGADLVVDAVDEPPGTLVVGSSFSLGDTTRNAGTAGVSASLVGYYLSLTPSRGPSALRLNGQRRQTGPVAPGATSTGSVRVTVPAVPAGSYYLVACADVSSQVAESDDDNNCTASSGTTGIGPADMTVSALTDPPPMILVGDSISVDDTTLNQGHLSAVATTTQFFLSPDPLPGNDQALATRPVPGLAAGAGSTATTEIPVALTTAPGDYFLVACADATGVIAEAFEANNCRVSASPVTVRPLDTTCGPDTGGIVIDDVVLSNGFTQMRQGTPGQLVITGSGLDATTEVRLDEIPTTLQSISATEVRAGIVIPHGTAPGPRTLTVRAGTDADCSSPDAIEVTFFVIAPAGSPNGQGTFQSPLDLCAPALPDNAGANDSVLLLAGVHECASVSLDGVTIAGQGIDSTTVNGAFVLGANVTYGATLRDMTIVAPDLALDLQMEAGGQAAVHDVSAPGGGIAVSTASGRSQVAVTGYVFTGPGTGLHATDGTTVNLSGSQFSSCTLGIFSSTAGPVGNVARVDVSDSSIAGCSTGLLTEDGFATLVGTTISDSDIAIDISFTEGSFLEFPFSLVELIGSSLVDNTIGARVQAGTLEVTDSDIVGDDSTPRPSEWGILMQWGLIETIGLTISGQERGGIEVTFDNPPPNTFSKLELRDSVIDGGERGIYGHGPGFGMTLYLQSTIVRNQTVAALSWAIGQPSAVIISGTNQLSVLSGFALEDLRTDVSSFEGAIQAAGLTLNGHTYSGLVEGPVSVPPDYRILSDEGAILF
jgi:hypothetical protein